MACCSKIVIRLTRLSCKKSAISLGFKNVLLEHTVRFFFYAGGQRQEDSLRMRNSSSTNRALGASLGARSTRQSVTAWAEHGWYVVIHADPTQKRFLQSRQLISRRLQQWELGNHFEIIGRRFWLYLARCVGARRWSARKGEWRQQRTRTCRICLIKRSPSVVVHFATGALDVENVLFAYVSITL